MERPVLLNSLVDYTINMKCKNILLEYEQQQNLDVCTTQDKNINYNHNLIALF